MIEAIGRAIGFVAVVCWLLVSFTWSFLVGTWEGARDEVRRIIRRGWR